MTKNTPSPQNSAVVLKEVSQRRSAGDPGADVFESASAHSLDVHRVARSEVMSADAVAELLGVNRKTVYEGASRGEIPHRRLGKRILFSRTAVLEWLSCKLPVSTER